MWSYIAARENLQDLDGAQRREFLLTNGLGGYCSQSVLGCNTRRYHGLLVAAAKPPLDRRVLLTHLDELLILPGQQHYLNTTEYHDGFYPDGYKRLTDFLLDPLPVWRWRVGEVEVTKRLVMVHGCNCLMIQYALEGPTAGAKLVLSPFVAMRSFHHLSHEHHNLAVHDRGPGTGYRLAVPGAGEFWMEFSRGEVAIETVWYNRVHHRLERERGQDDVEDLLRIGHVTIDFERQKDVTIVAALGAAEAPPTFETAVQAELSRRKQLVARAQCRDQREQALVIAADQFIVERHYHQKKLLTMIAGYHWFSDWCRDTMIALPGLCLVTGRHAEARQVLELYAGLVSEGMLPNRFEEEDNQLGYNSVDSALWFVQTASAYATASGDLELLRSTLWPAMVQIISAYHRGTRFNIHADADGLIVAGTKETQLTWMDAKHGGVVFTPRSGKAVEINALWISGLYLLNQWSKELGLPAPEIVARRDEISETFRRVFWNPQTRCLNDCLTDGAANAKIRPNQLFAVSLPYAPMSGDQALSIVDVCREKLLTPYGLRSLAPDDSDYHGLYVGNWFERDAAYHQGTAWAFLLGSYIDALMVTSGMEWSTRAVTTQASSGDGQSAVGATAQGVPGQLLAESSARVESLARTESTVRTASNARAEATQIIGSVLRNLDDGALGTINEIFDGNLPQVSRGCVAQAWSVAEILRVKHRYEL